MPKRSRNPDNSKRPQPVAQQRAQARLTAASTSVSAGKNDSQTPTGKPERKGHARQG